MGAGKRRRGPLRTDRMWHFEQISTSTSVRIETCCTRTHQHSAVEQRRQLILAHLGADLIPDRAAEVEGTDDKEMQRRGKREDRDGVRFLHLKEKPPKRHSEQVGWTIPLTRSGQVGLPDRAATNLGRVLFLAS